MISLLISLLVLAGVGGTVAVSDSATPGNFLFPVDQAVEKVQLVFANKEKEVKLKAKFAQERLDEVDELLAEDLNDDSGDVDDSNKEEVEAGLSFAIDLIGQINKDDQFTDLTDQLNVLLSDLPEGTDLNVKVNDSGSSFLKVRSESEDGENKIKLEIKETGGGDIIIKTETENTKQEVEMENADGSKFKVKVEDDGRLKIETEEAEVKVDDSQDDKIESDQSEDEDKVGDDSKDGEDESKSESEDDSSGTDQE